MGTPLSQFPALKKSESAAPVQLVVWLATGPAKPDNVTSAIVRTRRPRNCRLPLEEESFILNFYKGISEVVNQQMKLCQGERIGVLTCSVNEYFGCCLKEWMLC